MQKMLSCQSPSGHSIDAVFGNCEAASRVHRCSVPSHPSTGKLHICTLKGVSCAGLGAVAAVGWD